jgi:hypothetical protein
LRETKGVGTRVFLSFLYNLLAEPLMHSPPFISRFIVLDNVGFHRSSAVLDAVESSPHSAHFLPPYSPFLNPIENIFGIWKAEYVKHKAQTIDEVIAAIQASAQAAITPQVCQHAFEHTRKYFEACKQLQSDIV